MNLYYLVDIKDAILVNIAKEADVEIDDSYPLINTIFIKGEANQVRYFYSLLSYSNLSVSVDVIKIGDVYKITYAPEDYNFIIGEVISKAIVSFPPNF